MDFIELVTWPGVKRVVKKRIKRLKNYIGILYLNKDHHLNVVINQGHLP